MHDTLTLAPTADPRVFLAPDGQRLSPPVGWACLPPGDAGLTRRVKAAGPWWAVVEKRGRKAFSQGLWADGATIERLRAELERERESPAYAKKLASGRARREREQAEYVVDFTTEVFDFLHFNEQYTELAQELARRIAAHATPVGSGTVARTERIPIERRAEAAVIAWMRHQTTSYDHMKIARIKGERRAVRRELAEISRAVLDTHRGARTPAHAAASCPLCTAAQTPVPTTSS